VNNVFYKVNGDGTYSSVGTLNGNVNLCYFTQSSPVPVSSTNTVSGNLTLTVPGTVDWTVPTGVTLIYATVVGAGGGGGSSTLSGDAHGGANGGSGGYYQTQPIIVSPTEVLTFTVGSGGAAGTNITVHGSDGGSSIIARAGTPVFTATGGNGGKGCVGDNAPLSGGLGGTPGGVDGSYQASWMVNRNTPGKGYDGKGKNPTGYGDGGLGGNYSGPGATYVGLTALGYAGSNGAIIINY
jgi:hypothetical protein